jgi:hypothetical protein
MSTTTANITAVIAKLNEILQTNQQQFERYLEEYFTFKGHGRDGSFFEILGGRGDEGESKNYFTFADLYAITCLSVKVPPQSGLKVVDGDLFEESSRLLAKLPTNQQLFFPYWQRYGKSIDELFQLLKGLPGVDWVTASKMISRKRPRLVAILDNVVFDALNLPDAAFDDWEILSIICYDSNIRQLLTQMSRDVQNKNQGNLNVTRMAGLPIWRILDICVWEEHRKHSAYYATSKKNRVETVAKQEADGCLFLPIR